MYIIINKSTKIPTAQTKYSNLGNMLSAQEWRNVYNVPFQCLNDPTLLWFPYRILHIIITTNTCLYKIKYIESNICDLSLTARNIGTFVLRLSESLKNK